MVKKEVLHKEAAPFSDRLAEAYMLCGQTREDIPKMEDRAILYSKAAISQD